MTELEEQASKLGVADSIEAAVAMLANSDELAHRLSLDQVKQAKTNGCPAFRGSRVYLDELLAWWEANADSLPSVDSELNRINREIAGERLRKIRFANDIEEGKFVRREDEAAKLLALGLELKATLRRKLEDEYPDRLTQRTRDEVLQLTRALVDEICRLFQTRTEKWLQPKQ